MVTGKTFPAFPAHAHPQFCVSGKRPIEANINSADYAHGSGFVGLIYCNCVVIAVYFIYCIITYNTQLVTMFHYISSNLMASEY